MSEPTARGQGPQADVLRSLLHAERLPGWPHPLILGDLRLARGEDGRVRLLDDGLDRPTRATLASAGDVELVTAGSGKAAALTAGEGVVRSLVTSDGGSTRVRVEVGALTGTGFEPWEIVEVELHWDGEEWAVRGTPIHLAT
jgi:hypothetical protein